MYYMVTVMAARDDGGKFAIKGESERVVKSLRMTEDAWDSFGEMAEARGMTRADLLHEWIEAKDSNPDQIEMFVDEGAVEEAIDLLQDALSLKANAGGAIKANIRAALKTLGAEVDS